MSERIYFVLVLTAVIFVLFKVIWRPAFEADIPLVKVTTLIS